MKATPETIARRAAHHAALETLIPGTPGLTTWRRLARLEREAHAAATAQCNGEAYAGQPFRPDWLPDGSEGTEENPTQFDSYLEGLLARIAKACGGALPVGFKLNHDPRGHALKLDPAKCTIPAGIVTDWGGYGILAAVID